MRVPGVLGRYCFLLALLVVGLNFVGQSLHAQQPEVTASGSTAQPSAPPTRELDRGDNAWMLTSSALVLMMTTPGLAMFYGGLVRRKNVLGVLMQCIFLMGLMSVI